MTRLLGDLIAESAAFDEHKEDFTVKTADLGFDENARLTVPTLFGKPMALDLSSTALSQVCQRLGPPEAGYINDCPSWLAATNLNHWLADDATRRPGGEWFVRRYDNGARAVLSGKYSPINNTDVLKIVKSLVEESPGGPAGYRLVRSVVTPHYTRVRIIVADSKDGNYGVGFMVQNGETGGAALVVAPFVQRHSCTNSTVWDRDREYRQAHIFVTTAAMKAFITDIAGHAIGVAAERLEALIAAQQIEIPSFIEAVARVCKDHSLSAAVESNVILGSENSRTAFGLSNGLSFAAHATEGLSDQQRFDLESLAGRVLVERSAQS